MTNSELRKYLGKVQDAFDVKEIVGRNINHDDIVNYYTQSEAGYRFFHSTDGSIHMALNYDGVFNKEGYYGQAKIVQEHITELGVKKVLELASGRGFNSIYLAKANPNVKFVGIDLTPSHVEEAARNASGLPNATFERGNFQALSFQSESFDLVFVIESICHATDMTKALTEAYRVLKPTGRLIVVDGFRTPGFKNSDEDIQTAAKLVEVSMSVGHAWVVNDWSDLAENVGFKILSTSDVSKAIMPNLLRFQLLARGFFKFRLLRSAFMTTLPPFLVQNAIAGLLMPFTIEAGAQGYYVIVLERP